MIFDTVLGRNEFLNAKHNELNIAAILPFWHAPPRLCRVYMGSINVKMAVSEKIALLFHMYAFRTVCLLHNLTLDGKLFLRDDKNAAFV